MGLPVLNFNIGLIRCWRTPFRVAGARVGKVFLLEEGFINTGNKRHGRFVIEDLLCEKMGYEHPGQQGNAKHNSNQ